MAYSIRKSTGRNSGFSPKPNKILGCTRKGAWGADGGGRRTAPLYVTKVERCGRPTVNSELPVPFFVGYLLVGNHISPVVLYTITSCCVGYLLVICRLACPTAGGVPLRSALSQYQPGNL